MNYLAHAYLSFNQPGILTGNMISDFVKGKKKFDYTPVIQKGIMLHRAIDEFTDFHPATAEAKTFFRNDYRLYSGAFVDVAYDHFLANDVAEFFDETELAAFCQLTYTQLGGETEMLPEKFTRMFPYMQEQNWLFHYRLQEGIEKSFGGLVRRAAYLNDSSKAYNIFLDNYSQLQECYQRFFPELKKFAFYHLAELNNS